MKQARTYLAEAISIAARAHAGQNEKNGDPYIFHPLRAMLRCKTNTDRIVAVLHDVIEDTDWTMARLKKSGFSRTVLSALDCVTKRDAETYDAFIKRILKNKIAIRVKLADLEDNLDTRRLPRIREKDKRRLAKYRKYRRILQKALKE